MRSLRLFTTVMTLAAAGGATAAAHAGTITVHLPYAGAGLDERTAAAFLLDRLAYGARPGEVDRIVAIGLEQWVSQQLGGTLPEPELDRRLAAYEALTMSDAELTARYPTSSQLSAHVRRFHPGLIPGRDEPVLDFSVVTAKLDAYRAERGILSQDRELRDQVLAQKIERALLAENQLREVLTDFWENHLFTSPASFNARAWFLAFERDAVRPNALGNFRTLLGATTRHPAMLQYYVNAAAPANVGPQNTTLAATLERHADAGALRAAVDAEIAGIERDDDLVLSRQFWAPTGPNEVFARSLLGIQTLGADGAFTATDVADVARAFTGWSTAPIGPSPEWYADGLTAALAAGFVRDGSFLFRADRHDALPKHILGHEFAAGGGLDEGERVLDLLAASPDTARHIARKLAVRFVGDTPPEALVARLAAEFTATDGDIATVVAALVSAPEFWQSAARRNKVKTPLEFAASAVRATGATVARPTVLAERIAALGQPLYIYLEPTGYPDTGEYWLDSAALLARINFAHDLTANRIDGIAVDAAALARSPTQLLPGRNVDAVLARVGGNTGTGTAATLSAAGLVLASPEFQLR